MITTTADVKILGKLYSQLGNGAPTTATAGTVGDIYVDVDSESDDYGNSYLLEAESSGTYTWTQDTTYDAEIERYIKRAEQDYKRIRGKAFDVEDDDIVYPDGADLVAAEMVLFLMGILDGRGKSGESLNGRSAQYEKKIGGYPKSIVGSIEKYVGVV